MFPSIQLGSLEISTYAFMYTLAFMIGGVVAVGRIDGTKPEDALYRNSMLVLILFIFIGLYLPSYAEVYIKSWVNGQPPEQPHMRVYYGLGLGLLACLAYLRWKKLDFMRYADETAPVFGLAFAIARVGCLAAGCCGGAVTTSLLGIYAPDNNGMWAVRYPTQIMSMVFQLALFFGLTWLGGHRPGWLKARGSIFWLYLFLLCFERFVLEWLRYDYAPLLGPFSLPHIYMLAGMAAAAVGLVLAMRQERRKSERLSR